MKTPTNAVVDQNQVHWLFDGNCLKVKEIAQLLHCYLVTNPILRSKLSQRSSKPLDFTPRVDICDFGRRKLAGLIRHAD